MEDIPGYHTQIECYSMTSFSRPEDMVQRLRLGELDLHTAALRDQLGGGGQISEFFEFCRIMCQLQGISVS